MEGVVEVLESGDREEVKNRMTAAMNSALRGLERELEADGYTGLEPRGREIGYSPLREEAVGIQRFDTDTGPIEVVYRVEKAGVERNIHEM